MNIVMSLTGALLVLLALSILLGMAYLHLRHRRVSRYDVDHAVQFGWISLAFVAGTAAYDFYVAAAGERALFLTNGTTTASIWVLGVANVLVAGVGVIWLVHARDVRRRCSTPQYTRTTSSIITIPEASQESPVS